MQTLCYEPKRKMWSAGEKRKRTTENASCEWSALLVFVLAEAENDAELKAALFSTEDKQTSEDDIQRR